MSGSCEAGISISYMPFIAFCSGRARFGEKIPERSEDDFFSQPVRRTTLHDRKQKATFAGKKLKYESLYKKSHPVLAEWLKRV